MTLFSQSIRSDIDWSKKHNKIGPLLMKLHILKTVIFTKSQKIDAIKS